MRETERHTHELQQALVAATQKAEQLAARVQQQEELLRVVQEVSPTGFVLYRALRDEHGVPRDLELVYQNLSASRINGLPDGAFPVGVTLRKAFPGIELSALWEGHLQVLESGIASQVEGHFEFGRVNGWFRLARSRPAHDLLAVTFDDVSDERRVRDQQREAASTNETLLRVTQAISGLDLAAIVQAVTDEATTLCRAEFGAFFYNLIDPRGESYMLYSLSGVPRSAFEKFPMPRNTQVFAPTFAGTGVKRAADITATAEYGHMAPHHGMPAGHLPVRSYLAVPVVSRTGQVHGGLFFGHSRVGVFTEADEKLVVAVAQQAALAMDNAHAIDLAQRERNTAEAASRTKDDFLATISHELRTPLQSVLGWTHMLRSGSLDDANRQRALEAVERNAKAQAALIDDILDVSRIIAGKLRIEVLPVQLAEVVRAALDTVRPAADARGVRLQAVLDPDAGTVLGDADRLQQVVWNLLSNAVKFSPRDARVFVMLKREHSAVELAVSDEGQGIAAEFLPHVFDRFRQADASVTRKSSGLGLGLSIVKHVVELHGGTVVAESPGEGLGALFTVRIPIAPLRAVEPPPERVPSVIPQLTCPPAIAGLRVLVVDDEDDARDLLRALLDHGGASVRAASNVREALALLKADPPDVLVTDIGMPEQDGYALIEQVRALPAERGGRTPAVALTAYARSEDRTRALLKGFNHHVAKPVDP
ncbi:MAG TPA: ATP-binding protein, partial [Polyangiales bacterium]|nr:ATP-binding protein [Polyangiales bacterium]